MFNITGFSQNIYLIEAQQYTKSLKRIKQGKQLFIITSQLGRNLDASFECDLDASLGTALYVLLDIDSNSEHELGSDDEELLALLDTF